MAGVTSTAGVGVLPPRRREELLRTAAAEFARHGYEQASLNRIIRTCRMSKSSFYHYFDAKDALFDAVLTEYGGALIAALDLPDPEAFGGDFWAEISGLVDRLTGIGRDERFAGLGRLFYLPDAPSRPGTTLHRARRRVDDWLTAALASGRSAGAIRSDLPAELQIRISLAVLWAMDEWSLDHLDELDAAEQLRLATGQVEAIRRLLAP